MYSNSGTVIKFFTFKRHRSLENKFLSVFLKHHPCTYLKGLSKYLINYSIPVVLKHMLKNMF